MTTIITTRGNYVTAVLRYETDDADLALELARMHYPSSRYRIRVEDGADRSRHGNPAQRRH